MIESLEGRVLFTRYELLPVLNYTDVGTSYKYATVATIGQNEILTAGQKSTTSKTLISKTGSTYTTKTTTADNDGNESLSLVQGTSGVNLSAESVAYTGGSISMAFSDLQLAPASLGLNKKYNGSGTASGSFSFKGPSAGVTATFSGSASTSTTLYGITSITVRGHTYDNAMEGAFGIDISGTMKATANGNTASGPVKIVQTETFWSVPNVGIVYDRRGATTSGSAGGVSATVPLSSKDSLISYVLGANA